MTPALTTALSRGPAPLFELAARYLEEYLGKIRLAVASLPGDRLWWRPAPGTNSSGNLLLHLCGNLTLWVLGGVGGEAVRRDRAAEFAADGGADADELLARLDGVVARCAALLRSLDAAAGAQPRSIQGYTTDVLGAAFHAVEHMSYHTGQILMLAKQSLPPGAAIELYPQHRGE